MLNFEKVFLKKFFENLEITFWDSLKKHRQSNNILQKLPKRYQTLISAQKSIGVS